MAKPVGLNKRGNRYYLRVVIPDDLAALYGGRAAVNPALGTSDRADAHIRGHALRAQWEAEFAAKRRSLSPDPLPSVTPELVATLAARIRHRVLSDDDRFRSDPLLRADLRHYRAAAKARQANPLAIIGLAPPDVPQDDDGLSGATADELLAMADTNASIDGDAAVSMASRNLAAVLPLVKAEALALGLSFDVAAPGARDALLACLGAYRKAWHEVTQRDTGEVVDTPPMPAAVPSPAPASVKTLRDVYERWKVSGDTPKGADNLASVDRALRKFESQHPQLPLNAITRDMGDQYRTWIRTEFATPKTARDSLDRIKTLMNYAADTLRWIDRNEWRGLSIKATTTNKRRPWREDELKALFGSPVFTRYDLPRDAKAGHDGAYWVPLLGLYTGARPGELCQLRVADVLDVEGMPMRAFGLVCSDPDLDGPGKMDRSIAGRSIIALLPVLEISDVSTTLGLDISRGNSAGEFNELRVSTPPP